MKPIQAKTPMDTLLRAMELVEGAVHCIVIIEHDEGENTRYKVVSDEALTLEHTAWMLDTVKYATHTLADEED